LNLASGGEAWRVAGCMVSANLFAVLGVDAELGSVLRTGDDQPGRDDGILLSHALWRERFASDQQIVGKVIAIGNVNRRVIGVMRAGFAFPNEAARFWIPLRLDPRDQQAYWAGIFMPILARLRTGATLAQAQGEIQSLSREMIALYPYPMGRDFNAQATVVPLRESLVSGLRTRLLVLQLAIGLVLLIACANVANLLMARASSRQKEMALRVALGAARGRIVRQLLTESVVLALGGGAAGLALAGWGISLLKLALPPGAPGWSDFTIGTQVLLFAAALSVLTGLGFGLAPALLAFRQDLALAIRTGSQRSAGAARTRFRGLLIVAEVALAVILSVGAGLLIRSLWRLAHVDPGFATQHVLTVRVSPEQSLCRERAQCIALYDALLQRTRSVSGVFDAAAANTLPLSASIPSVPVVAEGQPYVPSERVAPLFWAGAVTPEYFPLMHIPVVAGRGFTEADGEHAAPVVVVSAATARRYWPGQNPIGKHVRPVFENAWRTVIGVAADVRQYDLANRAPDFVSGAMYMPYRQSVQGDRQLPASMTLIVRTASDPSLVAAGIRAIVRDLNPNVPVSEVRTMASLVDASTQQPRAMAWLFAAFAGLALLLAAVGAYGVISWSTAQRTFEIGLRMALGAPRQAVFVLVLGQSLKLVTLGLVLGIAASFLLTRMLASFLYATASSDALTLAGVSVILIGVALLAGYLPARRAARIDPIAALRAD
jgi:putative ABC transport system permease protein